MAGVSSVEEAIFCGEVGVAALGFTLELPTGLHDGLTAEMAQQIISLMPDHLMPVLITYVQTAETAVSLVRLIKAAAVQFHGGIKESELRAFRRVVPRVKTIGRVTIHGQHAIPDAERFTPALWDAIILDSFDPRTGRLGATGLTHDWSISSAVVRRARLPVILAGGLTPDNVAQAISQVRPAGVDVHTGVENPDGSRNFGKIRRFTHAAREAFAALRTMS